jgi:hypothetical protein
MSAIQKYSEGFKKLEFCDDFGDVPIGIGNLTDDQGTIAIVGLVTSFVAVAGLGLPGLALTAYFFVNDFIWAGRHDDDDESKPVVIDSDGAIDVAAAPTMAHTPTLNPVTILAASICHRGVWGGQRTGKSLLISVASQAMAETHDVEVWYVNLYAADRAETLAMYGHADRVLIADLAGDCHNPELIIDELGAMVAAFKKKSSILLIIDELPTMASTLGEYSEALSAPLKALCGHVTDLGQSAMKRKKAVWSIGAGIVAVNLTNEGKAMLKGFKPVLVSVVADRGVTWNGQAVLPDPNIVAQLKVNFPGQDFTVPSMDCDRVVQVDGQWLPMPKLEVPPATQKMSVGESNWERMKEGTGRPDEAIETAAVEVEAVAVVEHPDGLEDFPLVLTIWEYLAGKDARSMKQISDAMKAKGKIPEDVLKSKIGNFETYKDAIKTVVSFGVSQGFLNQVSEDAYEAIRKH